MVLPAPGGALIMVRSPAAPTSRQFASRVRGMAHSGTLGTPVRAGKTLVSMMMDIWLRHGLRVVGVACPYSA
jgi:hypothetical protein